MVLKKSQTVFPLFIICIIMCNYAIDDIYSLGYFMLISNRLWRDLGSESKAAGGVRSILRLIVDKIPGVVTVGRIR